ncbi:TonB-dependent receptor [Xanthomonas campestris]|uniref:TonB-dependent receptor n=1 Tax=Xanthomonas campestris TaxID=339 RepID=UPI0005C3D743|nr:TonB-dependent receptor [Xanthomonas campestris]MBD8246496.1 TonB-dependent receptor [Xanthomonas campestris]MCD0250797.1 TonB-dependent receptor [Xanthomonas campestris pv. campestris]MCD0263647.1 TonB-dependent receptor [Xanthomonas campestris pv. campestris]MCD0271954.1 TonB-dependent receptor [Xanthomonas campestris pv. campestris]MCD0275884.1 TonB-dependent receptor [Xanthomonas campestris pv. campestris]
MSVQHRHIPAGRAVGQRSIREFRRSVMAISVATLLSAQAYAQDATTTAAPASDATTQQLDTVQVTGTRSSVTKAQLVKQNAEQIVDSIVAEDIGKLPDNNVAEALQRISGIQISRNYGEGSSIAIRGLTQVRTELNGRDIFTANDGRGLSFEDVSAELLGGVNVYKNPSADMIEGGLGGTVDLRTRLPFDYEGRKIAGSVQYNYYDLADDGKPAFSGLFSDRWQTGIGEIGILVNYSQQKSPFRQDTISIEPWYTQTDLPGYEGQGVSVPHGAGINTTIGERERKTGAFAMQWRPNDSVEVYTQVLRSDYDFSWQDYSFFALTQRNPIQGLPGIQVNDRNEFVNGSFQNVPTESNTSLTERHSVTTDYSLGAKWTVNEKLTLSTDFQYVDATTTGTRYIVATGQDTSPQFNVDFRGDLPRLSVTDASGAEGYLADVNNYDGWRYHLDNKDDNKGTEFAWRADMDLAFDSDFVRSFKAGVRYTDRDAETKGNIYRFMCLNTACGAATDSPFAAFPSIGIVTNPITDFFRGESSTFGRTLTAANSAVSNYEQTLATFGASPLVFAPNNINAQTEKTYAAYGVLRFGVDSDSIPFDGNIGVRVVRTEVGSNGVRTGTDAEGGGLIPVAAQQTYTDVLPSLNLRWMLSDQLQWRFAASRGISRPTFDRLNPNLSLSTGTSNGASTFTGTAGNPSLEAVKADQFDTALEWYFGQGSMMYGTLFYKKVEGFIANAVFNEVYDGQVWQITRPVNGDAGKIRGAELGYTQFFDFLPGWLSGFGLQTNYTYVDSEAPSPTATDTNGQSLTVPLEGLSKNSYNAILSYETARFQGRVAYNWRSDWLVTTAGNGTENLPVYNKGFGQLDASLRFNINDVWSISLDGVNLLDTRRESYLGTESRYRDFVINDRRYGLTLRASL